MTKNTRRLGVAAALLTICTILLTMQAHAQDYPVESGEFTSVSPTATTDGSLSMSGCGFEPGADVVVTVDGVQAGTAVADAAGCFAATFDVPDGVSAGTHEVRATGPSPTGTRVLSANVTVSNPTTGGTNNTTGGATNNNTGGALAQTGTETATTVGIALALCLAGFVLVMVGRRLRNN